MRLIDKDELLHELKRSSDVAAEARMTLIAEDFIDLVNDADVVEVPRWIPVTERLPENTVDVLVFRPKMKIEIGISCRINDEWLRYGKDLHGNDVITHWMPLPEPPEVE